jgi:hypothetical protein
LKKYGPLSCRGGVQPFFYNGFSANERTATLSNWERLGFPARLMSGPSKDHIVLLANNRSDRPARSASFASVLALDLAWDTLVIMGSNEEGLKRSVLRHLETQFARWMNEGSRLAVSQSLRCEPPEEWASFSSEERRRWLREHYHARVVVVPAALANNSQKLSDETARFASPGVRQHIFGVMNIKGPGLLWLEFWNQVREGEAPISQLDATGHASSESSAKAPISGGKLWLEQLLLPYRQGLRALLARRAISRFTRGRVSLKDLKINLEKL